jgi:hypothetical protein
MSLPPLSLPEEGLILSLSRQVLISSFSKQVYWAWTEGLQVKALASMN